MDIDKSIDSPTLVTRGNDKPLDTSPSDKILDDTADNNALSSLLSEHLDGTFTNTTVHDVSDVDDFVDDDPGDIQLDDLECIGDENLPSQSEALHGSNMDCAVLSSDHRPPVRAVLSAERPPSDEEYETISSGDDTDDDSVALVSDNGNDDVISLNDEDDDLMQTNQNNQQPNSLSQLLHGDTGTRQAVSLPLFNVNDTSNSNVGMSGFDRVTPSSSRDAFSDPSSGFNCFNDGNTITATSVGHSSLSSLLDMGPTNSLGQQVPSSDRPIVSMAPPVVNKPAVASCSVLPDVTQQMISSTSQNNDGEASTTSKTKPKHKKVKLDAEGNPIKPKPRKKAEVKYDAEGNVIKAKPRKKAEVKYDTDGNPIKPKPRKKKKVPTATLR